MKQVIQLDDDCFFVGYAFADESPLEPGVYLLPGRCVDAETPENIPGRRARWNGEEWEYESPPDHGHDPEPQYIPHEVTMRQARLALLAAGKLAGVEAAIASMPEPHKTAASIEWEYSNALQRSNPFVAQLGAALGIDDAAIDALFVAASKL